MVHFFDSKHPQKHGHFLNRLYVEILCILSLVVELLCFGNYYKTGEDHIAYFSTFFWTEHGNAAQLFGITVTRGSFYSMGPSQSLVFCETCLW